MVALSSPPQAHGSPGSFYATTGAFQGQGGFLFNSAGEADVVGVPATTTYSTFSFNGLGGTYAMDAGYMSLIGSPSNTFIAILWFAGLGGNLYVGAGAATVGGSPAYAISALQRVSPSAFNFDVMRNRPIGDNGSPFSFVSRFRPVHPPAPAPAPGPSPTPCNGTNNGTANCTSASQRFMRRELAWERRLGVDPYNTVKIFNQQRLLNLSFIPKAMLDAAAKYPELRAKLEARSGRKLAGMGLSKKDGRPDYYVGEGMDGGDCAVCGVDTSDITGPGAGHCSVDRACPKDLPNAGGDEWDADVPYTDYHVYPSGSVKVCCEKNGAPACTDPDTVRRAMMDSFPDFDFKVSVSKVAAEYRIARKLMTKEQHERHLLSLDPRCDKFDLNMVVSGQDHAQEFETKMADGGDETLKEEMVEYIDFKNQMSSNFSDVAVEDVEFDVTPKNKIYIPAYNTAAFRDLAGRGFKGMNKAAAQGTVTVLNSEGHLVSTLKRGDTYTVVLNDVEVGHTYVAQLIGSRTVGKREVQTAQPLKMITTRKSSSPAFAWTVKATQPLGEDYYLKVTDTTSQGELFSSAITISDEARLRKLGHRHLIHM
jgi:hypothetical protein